MSGSQESTYLCHFDIWVICKASWFRFFGELDCLEGEFSSTVEGKVGAVKEGRSLCCVGFEFLTIVVVV